MKCAGLWAAGTAGPGEGHRGLPHPVRTDQISKHLSPWRTKGWSPELRYTFVRSTVMYLWYFKLPGLFWPSYLCPIFIFSCCSEQAVAEINPCSSNWIRIRNLSGFQVSSLFFNCDLFVCMAYSHHTTQSYIYTLKQLMWLDKCRRFSEANQTFLMLFFEKITHNNF